MNDFSKNIFPGKTPMMFKRVYHHRIGEITPITPLCRKYVFGFHHDQKVTVKRSDLCLPSIPLDLLTYN